MEAGSWRVRQGIVILHMVAIEGQMEREIFE